MVAVNYVSRMNTLQDVHQQGPQRTKFQSFCKGLKKTGRILLGVATLGISEGIARHTLKGRGAKVSSRANNTTSIGMNHYLRKEVDTVLNGVSMSPKFTTRIKAEQILGDLSGISDEVLGSVFDASVRDFGRADYSIGGDHCGSGKQVLEKMIQLCTDNGVVDKGALRAVSSLANQSIHGVMMSGPLKYFGELEPPLLFGESLPSNISYNVEAVINKRGEREFVIKTGCDVQTAIIGRNGPEPISKGSQTATIRLTRNEDGSYKAKLEDYQCSFQATEGHRPLNISSKAIGKCFRDYIGDNIGVVEHLGVTEHEVRPEPTANRMGIILSKTHQLLDDDPEIASLATLEGNVGTIFRGKSQTAIALSVFAKELSANYVQDTLRTVVDYVNDTGSLDVSVPEDRETLRGLYQLLMEKIIGGTTCEQRNIDAVPQKVCDFCKTIFTRLLAAGANETTAKNGAMSFLFLRSMSPSLTIPTLNDPIIGSLGGKQEAQRTFVSLGRLLQYSVNGITTPGNPDFAKLGDTLEKYSTGMSNFMSGVLTKGTAVPDNPVQQHFVELLDTAPSEVREILEHGNIFDTTTGLETMKRNVSLVLNQIEKGIDFSPDLVIKNQVQALAPALRDFLESYQ